MFYVIGWITVIVLTLVASFGGFFWALKSGQFGDQNRPRFFPLVDLPPFVDTPRPVRRIAELYALIIGALFVICALIAAMILGAR
jgi:cbb3-type cytochrome oxidase maturation protein